MRQGKKYLHSILVKKNKSIVFYQKMWFWIIFIILKPVFLSIKIKQPFQKKPQNITNTDLKEVVKGALVKTTHKNFGVITISYAFYILTSFIPILSLIIVILFFASKLVQDVEINGQKIHFYNFIIDEILNKFIPGIKQSINFLNSLSVNNQVWKSVAFLLLLLSSFLIGLNGYGKFIKYYSLSYDHNEPIALWILKVKSFFTIIGIVISSSIVIYLASLPIFYIKYFSLQIHQEWLYNVLFYVICFFFLLAYFFIGTTFLFKFLPGFRLKRKWNTPGVWIMTIASTQFTFLFSLLVLNGYINYDKFGSVSTFLYLSTFSLYISQFYHFAIATNYAYTQKFYRKTFKGKWYSKISKSYENTLY